MSLTSAKDRRRWPRAALVRRVVAVGACLTVLSAPVMLSAQPDALGEPFTVAAVGDIACRPTSSSFNGGLGTSTECRQKYVADLIATAAPDAVLVLGDNQYDTGSLSDYNASYANSFGSLLDKTYPVPGNHEYRTAAAAGYYAYFGARAGDAAKGYYSTDLGGWHVIALNSNCEAIGGCSTSSPQGVWLAADLAASSASCTLAFMHHPRYNAGEHAGRGGLNGLWTLLYRAHADIVLAGHEHSYERFQLMGPSSVPDPVNGIRSWVVGTGGKSLYASTLVSPFAEVTDRSSYGALFLTLGDGSYSWEFRSESYAGFSDSGSETCR